MSISLPDITPGSTNWAGTVNGYWQTIQDVLNSLVAQNILINGGFDFAQRVDPTTPTPRANDTYGFDRWYTLTDGGASDIEIKRISGDTNSQYSGEIKQVNASGKKVALCQIVESNNVLPLRNKTVRFQVRVKSPSTTPPSVRLAIIESTATADTAVVSDVVNSWANSSDSNPNTAFLKAGSQTLANAYTSATALTSSYVELAVTGTVGAGANNLIVIAWTPSGVDQNDLVDITQAGLYVSNESRPWIPRPIQQEISLCQRYYEKSYNLDTVPGTVVNTSNHQMTRAETVAIGSGINLQRPIVFQVRKRIAPIVVPYSGASSGNWRIEGVNVAVTPLNVDEIGSLLANGTSGSLVLNGGSANGQWTADAEL